MHPPALLCSLPVAAVGIYYLVNAPAVSVYAAVEGQRASRARVRLRRVNGAVMILMGAALYVAISRSFGPDARPGLVAPLAWIAVLPLLVAMVGLALLDVRLTRALKGRLAERAIKGEGKRDGGRAGALALVALLAAGATSISCEDATIPSSPPVTAPSTAPATRPTPPAAAQSPPAGPQPQQLEVVQMTLGGKAFRLQLANDPDERETGLMHRRSLAADAGMIFVFPDADYRGFWMKNTLVPLDILYLDEDGLVLNVEQMAPRDLRHAPSAGPAKYAIELPLNTAKALGLKAGMRLDIPAAARDAGE